MYMKTVVLLFYKALTEFAFGLVESGMTADPGMVTCILVFSNGV
jgi:hypothetical protein